MNLRHDFSDARPVARAGFIWVAVRMRQPKNHGRRTAVVGGEFEEYKNRAGQTCHRHIKGTGERVFVAEHILKEADFQVYMPKRYDWRKTNRYSNERTRVEYPAMGDWLFVGWPDHLNRWHDMMALEVVAGVLGSGGNPLVISERDIIALMAEMGRRGLPSELQRYMRTDAEFDVGDMVRVSSGSLEGYETEVVEIDGPSALIVMELFGRSVRRRMQISELEPVSF